MQDLLQEFIDTVNGARPCFIEGNTKCFVDALNRCVAGVKIVISKTNGRIKELFESVLDEDTKTYAKFKELPSNGGEKSD